MNDISSFLVSVIEGNAKWEDLVSISTFWCVHFTNYNIK